MAEKVMLTATQLAIEFGTQTSVVQTAMASAGFESGRGTKFRLMDVVKVLRPSDEMRAAKVRESTLRSDHLERQIAQMDDNLISLDQLREYASDTMMPLRTRILALPEALSSRCNPSDPIHARMALQEWVVDTLTNFQDALSEIPVGKAQGGEKPKSPNRRAAKKKTTAKRAPKRVPAKNPGTKRTANPRARRRVG